MGTIAMLSSISGHEKKKAEFQGTNTVWKKYNGANNAIIGNDSGGRNGEFSSKVLK